MNKPMIAVAVCLGLASTAATFWVLRRKGAGAEAELPSVVTATRAISQGATVTSEDVETGRLMMESPGEGMLTSTSQAVGMLAVRPIQAGAVVRAGDLSAAGPSDGVPEGKRAFVITVEAQIGAARLVRENDRVDILFVGTETGESETMAQNIRVMRVMGQGTDSTQSESGTEETLPESIDLLVEVSPEESARLMAAHTTGVLAVSLRNQHDLAIADLPRRSPAPSTSPDEDTTADRHLESEEPVAAKREPEATPAAPPWVFGAPEKPAREEEPTKKVTVIRGTKAETVEVEE